MFDNGDLVTAPAVITQLLRLQQVLCGHIRTDDGELIEIPSRRIDALMETIEEMTGKVIVWSRFRYDIKKIEAEMKKVHGPGSVVTYFGDTTDEQRQQAIKDFQFGDARFFVANPQTAGFGSDADGCNERDLLRQRLRLGDSDAVRGPVSPDRSESTGSPMLT